MTVSNSAQNAAVEVAAFSVDKALGGGLKGAAAGLMVQPITWAVTGNGPDAADLFIYGGSAIGTAYGLEAATVAGGVFCAAPAIVTGVIKSRVDDHNDARLSEARADEPPAVRDGMTKADDYSYFASMNSIQAMTIASYGGVCWRHRNGVYCYLLDDADLPVCDYTPQSWAELYRPLIPLRVNGDRVTIEYLCR